MNVLLFVIYDALSGTHLLELAISGGYELSQFTAYNNRGAHIIQMSPSPH